MRILLDTHIFIWWDSDPKKLSPSFKAHCENEENTLILSVASVWEIQIKQQLGKLTLRQPLAELIADQQKINGLEILAVALSHVLVLEELPHHHKDPFDRLLIAQANAEDFELLTADPIMRQYEVRVLT